MDLESGKGVRIGIQSSVMGWDDPWQEEACRRLMRTGEGKWFPSQDPTPEAEELLGCVKDLGADFYLHSVMPEQSEELGRFIEDANRAGLSFMLNNEFGDINGPHTPGTNRYDIPAADVEKAAKTGKLLGLIYDETEHLQMHPDIYSRLRENAPRLYQWTDPAGKSLQETEEAVAEAVRAMAGTYGPEAPMFSEQVFPVLYHALARGGLHPCPKVMKEEFQSVQLSSALGAARQYGRQFGVCADLWGPDVGPWFTRIWAFPGHSPAEFASALRLAYLTGPKFLFVENIDGLVRYGSGGFRKTEFGEAFERFAKEFVPAHPLPYTYADASADIVVIRSDDGEITSAPAGMGAKLYGGDFPRDERTQSVFQVFHLLSHGTVTKNGITFFLPEFEYPAAKYARNAETISRLPLERGLPEAERSHVHPLFYPMHNVLVFDEHADAQTIGSPRLIFLAGSRMTDACLAAVEEKVREGAVCIAASWLLPQENRRSRRDGRGQWIVVEDFLGDDAREAAAPWIGSRDCWSMKFGEYELRLYNDSKDGVTLTHEIAGSRRA